METEASHPATRRCSHMLRPHDAGPHDLCLSQAEESAPNILGEEGQSSYMQGRNHTVIATRTLRTEALKTGAFASCAHLIAVTWCGSPSETTDAWEGGEQARRGWGSQSSGGRSMTGPGHRAECCVSSRRYTEIPSSRCTSCVQRGSCQRLLLRTTLRMNEDNVSKVRG